MEELIKKVQDELKAQGVGSGKNSLKIRELQSEITDLKESSESRE